MGQSKGLQGQSYAIETLSSEMAKLTIEEISLQLDELVRFAVKNDDKTFIVTKIGCGIAGFKIEEISALFKERNFPLNVLLPVEFCVTKGFKVFNPNWKCRDMQFHVGGVFTTADNIEPCNQGIHFCKKLIDCYDYYSYDRKNKAAEVKVLGYTKTDDGKKYCTNGIEIVREVSWEEVDNLVNIGSSNSGRGNSGYRNSGDRNSGDRNSGDLNSGDLNSGDRNSGDRNSGDLNSGDRNSGDRNSGDLNSGDLNSGYRNSGYRNSGDRNSGDRNSGDLNSGYRNSGYRNSGDRNSGDLNSGYLNSGYLNSGDRNSGDLNSGYRNSGVFCTRQRNDTVPFFDKDSAMTWDEWYNHPAYNISRNLNITEWIGWDDMSDDEKKDNPKAYVCEGYIKVYSYKEAWTNLWKGLSESQKQHFASLPNFDSQKFEFITGISF